MIDSHLYSSFRDGAQRRARNPYVDGPRTTRALQGLIGSLASICPACSCGRSWPLAKMVSATRVPNNHTTFTGQWIPRSVSPLGSIDPTICSFSCSSGYSQSGHVRDSLCPADLSKRRAPAQSARARRRRSVPSPLASKRSGRSCWRAPPPRASAACAEVRR